MIFDKKILMTNAILQLCTCYCLVYEKINFECLLTNWLHVLSLGVFQVFIAALIDLLIEANAWNVTGNKDGKGHFRFILINVHCLLFFTYKCMYISGLRFVINSETTSCSFSA